MLKIILSSILFVTIISADIRIEKKSEGSYNHPTPEIREPLPNRIKYIKIRLPKRPMLEHRKLYRKLGILPEVTEYC